MYSDPSGFVTNAPTATPAVYGSYESVPFGIVCGTAASTIGMSA
jgi:hypothetical protein